MVGWGAESWNHWQSQKGWWGLEESPQDRGTDLGVSDHSWLLREWGLVFMLLRSHVQHRSVGQGPGAHDVEASLEEVPGRNRL